METNWEKLTLIHLYDYLGASVLDAIAVDDLASEQQNPWLVWINDITRRIRSIIRGNKTNRVSTDSSTLPPELLGVASSLVIELAASRTDALTLSDAQQATIREAKEHLLLIAKGELPVSTPSEIEDPDTMQRSSRVEVTHFRADRLTSARLTGL